MPVSRRLMTPVTVLLMALGSGAFGSPEGSPNGSPDGAPATADLSPEALPPAGGTERPSLERALRVLQARGLNLVFSNVLIKPDYRVTGEIDARLPLPEQALALLEPFGLELARASAGVWYVVRAQPAVAAEREGPPPEGAAAPRILEEVVVSSPRYLLVRDEHRRYRMTARELDAIPVIGRDPLRAVNLLPGQSSSGVSARSHMRGGNTDEVLYLIDGVQLIEPFHMGDFHALFSAVNPALVDSVNVYHAGFPAAFGSRLSGVVDMELTRSERPIEGRVNIDFVNASTQAKGRAGMASWLVSARRSTVDYLLDYVEQDYGRPRFHDELVRVSWEGEATDFTLGMLYGGDELTLEDQSAREMARADYENLTTWMQSTHRLAEQVDLELSGAVTVIDNERRGNLNDTVDAVGRLEETRDFNVAMFRGALRWNTGDDWSFHAGLEGQRQQADFEVEIFTRYGLLGLPLQPVPELLRSAATAREGRLLTAFLSARHRASDTVTVELGWRYDVQDMGVVQDEQFSPRVQITYDDGEHWRAFLNIGRYAQHQNLYELQLDDGLLELNDPQLADQLSIGADWSLDDEWRLRLEAYWRRIDDPWSRFENLYNRWVLLPELHADRVLLEPEQARTFGAEMLLDYRPSSELRWWLSLAVARAEERFNREWRPRPWQQRRTWRGGVEWGPGKWRIGAAAAYHTGWPITPLVTEPSVGPQRLYDAELPGYFSLDVRTARRFDLARSVLEVYLDLTNATAAENVGGYRYELDAGTLERDDRHLLPPVPVFGLTWSW